MKAVPILVALNLISWGVVLLLFLHQAELESRLDAVQAKTPLQMSEPGENAPEPDPFLGIDPANIELFRQRVRRAQELNAEEDRVLRFVDRIDRLIAESRVGQLSPEQKRRVAEEVLAARRGVPDVLRRLRERGDLTRMSREERSQGIRDAYAKLRDEAQKALEGIVAEEDARAIVEDTFGDLQGRTRQARPAPR